MKECPNCGELNGTERETCWKCGAELEKRELEKRNLEASVRKICPKCKIIYPREAEKCEKCGGPLGMYSEEANRIVAAQPRERIGIWKFVLAFLFPLVGFIMGLFHGIKSEVEECCALILTAIGGSLAWGLLSWCLSTLL